MSSASAWSNTNVPFRLPKCLIRASASTVEPSFSVSVDRDNNFDPQRFSDRPHSLSKSFRHFLCLQEAFCQLLEELVAALAKIKFPLQ